MSSNYLILLKCMHMNLYGPHLPQVCVSMKLHEGNSILQTVRRVEETVKCLEEKNPRTHKEFSVLFKYMNNIFPVNGKTNYLPAWP